MPRVNSAFVLSGSGWETAYTAPSDLNHDGGVPLQMSVGCPSTSSGGVLVRVKPHHWSKTGGGPPDDGIPIGIGESRDFPVQGGNAIRQIDVKRQAAGTPATIWYGVTAV